MTEQNGNIYRNKGRTRTLTKCTNCPHTFIAELDSDVNGDHVMICPWCGHEHFRTIKDGVVTEARWYSKNDPDKPKDPVRARRVWKSGDIQGQTSTASWFIQERWLEKLQK